MRALREIAETPYARHVVAKYTVAGTYTLAIPPGRYHITIVGGGGGAATVGITTEVRASSVVGKWGYATGGGGALAYGDILVSESVEASVIVGAGSQGSAMSVVYDTAKDGGTSIGKAGNSSISFGGLTEEMGGGNSTYVLVSVTSTGTVSTRSGSGGGAVKHQLEGFTVIGGNYGTMSNTPISEFTDGESGVVQGSAAGGGNVPIELGDAGRGGEVEWGYSDGVLTFSGGDGRDGAVLVERIG